MWGEGQGSSLIDAVIVPLSRFDQQQQWILSKTVFLRSQGAVDDNEFRGSLRPSCSAYERSRRVSTSVGVFIIDDNRRCQHQSSSADSVGTPVRLPHESEDENRLRVEDLRCDEEEVLAG